MQERRCDNYLTLRTSIPIRSLGVSIIHCGNTYIYIGKWYKGGGGIRRELMGEGGTSIKVRETLQKGEVNPNQ